MNENTQEMCNVLNLCSIALTILMLHLKISYFKFLKVGYEEKTDSAVMFKKVIFDII